MKTNIAILGSTRGSHLQPLFESLQQKSLQAQITLVLSDQKNAGILERAKLLNIPHEFLSAQGLSREAYGEILSALLKKHEIDLVILIGFMRILSPQFTQDFSGRAINIHPSLLPKHAGLMDLQVHTAAIEAGETQSGCTVHYVEAEVDKGKILIQKSCPISPNETPESLKIKVQALEVPALIQAIQLLIPA
jgi:phosphoribosylglycinamide formyltransferase-1